MIRNPSRTWLHLTASVGLTVQWNSRTIVRVTVSGKYRAKMCGLCGNFNGDRSDDIPKTKPECLPAPQSSVCQPESAKKNKCYMDLCNYMKMPITPFKACNSAVNPSQLIKDCQYDACECDDPMQCVCKSFTAYSQQCSDKGVVLKWRSQETYLFPPLQKCGKYKNLITPALLRIKLYFSNSLTQPCTFTKLSKIVFAMFKKPKVTAEIICVRAKALA